MDLKIVVRSMGKDRWWSVALGRIGKMGVVGL